MKTTLVIAFFLISMSAFSQYVEPQQSKPQHIAKGWATHTPGMELRKAGNSFFTALALYTGGSIFITVGSNLSYGPGGSGNSSAGAGDVTLGGFMIIGGFVYNIMAWVHVNRAGRLMDMNTNKVSFGGTKNGVGLTYNF